MEPTPADSAALFEGDLKEQPDCLARLVRDGRGVAEAVAARVRESGTTFAVLAARGTSDNAARYGQYLFGIRNGLVAALAAPSLLTRYKATPRMAGSLVIGLSQSGQSPDVVSVVSEGRRQGAVTVAVTNDPGSPLARAAELTFPLMAGTERAVAATKTYTPSSSPWPCSARPSTATRTTGRARGGPAAGRPGHRRRPRPGPGRRVLPQRPAPGRPGPRLQPLHGLRGRPEGQGDVPRAGRAVLHRRFPPRADRAPRAGAARRGHSPRRPRLRRPPKVLDLARERGARLLALSDDPALLSQAEVPLAMPAGCPSGSRRWWP